jgi:hypothetical protein
MTRPTATATRTYQVRIIDGYGASYRTSAHTS